MWEIYDALLAGMNESETVEEWLIGPRWSVVRGSSGSIGIAPVIVEKYDRFDVSYQPAAGMSLKDVAAHIRSWNFMEASLAMAAINAFYNDPGKRTDAGDGDADTGRWRQLPGGRRSRRAFRSFCEENTSEGVTVLAEPVYDNDEIAEVPGRMDVLRKEPEFRDYYVSAYRELIPETDRLVLSGRSFVEKNAEPMMERAVSCGKPVFLFGPDVPLCPALRQYGVTAVWGFEVEKPEELMRSARTGMQRDQFLRLGHFAVLEWPGRNG